MKGKIVIIGCAGAGVSKALSQILAEKNLTFDDVIFIDSSKDIKEQIDFLGCKEVFEITRNSIDDLSEIFIEPEVVPFSKFRETKYGNKHIGIKRNFSHRRR